jgi:ligand-binding sensor domain-containing protein
MKLIRYVLLCLAGLLHACAFAQIRQHVSYRHFDTRDGLPSTRINGILEDSRGYIWAITDKGAARYNGYGFEVFTSNQGLPSDNVLLIHEDLQGRIWFLCGTQYAYLENDSIRLFNGNDIIKKKLKGKERPASLFFEKDTMWVTTMYGTQLFKSVGDSVQEFMPQVPGDSKDVMYYLRRAGDKLLAMKTGEPQGTDQVITRDKINFLLRVSQSCKLSCSVSIGPDLWALAGPEAYVVFDTQGNVEAYFSTTLKEFSSLDKDRNGNLWICKGDGAYLLKDYASGMRNAHNYFPGQYISGVVQDRAGNYWFADRNNGLFFVPSLDMVAIQPDEPTKQSKFVSVKKFDNSVYACDAAGNIYSFGNNDSLRNITPVDLGGISFDFSLTRQGELLRGKTPAISNIDGKNSRILDSLAIVRKSCMLSDGRIALALADGLAFYDDATGWQRVDTSRFHSRTPTLFEDSQRRLWLGTNEGLVLYGEQEVDAIEEVNSLYKSSISDIVEWNDFLLLATRGKGIIFYQPGKTFAVDEALGLLSNNIECLAIDGNNRIWLGTSKGIQCINAVGNDASQWTYFQVNYQKGLPAAEVFDLLFDNEKFYAATSNGLCVFNPSAASLRSEPQPVYIEHLSVGDKTFDIQEELSLGWNENNVRFTFLSFNFRMGASTTYRYRLIGLTENWVETNSRTVDFWSLPPGRYVFEVCSLNEDGLWGPASSASFVIARHFTATWWFQSLIVLLLIGLIAGGFAWFYRSKRAQLVQRAKMTELRQQALNANMNPHFIFNALNSIQHFINSDQPELANEFLTDFSRLIRMNLENNLETLVPLDEEMERLELYLKLEKLRFGDKLTYSIEGLNELQNFDISIPPMLLQPYVENAVIHGILPKEKGGHIDIVLRAIGKHFEVEIRDNGIGLKAASHRKREGHESLALKMNEERLSILSAMSGSTFSIAIIDRSEEAVPAEGTLVRLFLPMEAVIEG